MRNGILFHFHRLTVKLQLNGIQPKMDLGRLNDFAFGSEAVAWWKCNEGPDMSGKARSIHVQVREGDIVHFVMARKSQSLTH